MSHNSKPTPVCFLTPLGPPPTYEAQGHRDSSHLISRHQDWVMCSSSPQSAIRWVAGAPWEPVKEAASQAQPPAPGPVPPGGPGAHTQSG